MKKKNTAQKSIEEINKRYKVNLIGFKEFRENSAKYISRIGKGESFTVLKRSKPVFKLIPIEPEFEYETEEEAKGWKKIIDFTEINPRGISAEDFIASLRRVHGKNR